MNQHKFIMKKIRVQLMLSLALYVNYNIYMLHLKFGVVDEGWGVELPKCVHW